jgi:hypothetical protein
MELIILTVLTVLTFIMYFVIYYLFKLIIQLRQEIVIIANSHEGLTNSHNLLVNSYNGLIEALEQASKKQHTSNEYVSYNKIIGEA